MLIFATNPSLFSLQLYISDVNRNRDESDFKKALDVLHIAYTVTFTLVYFFFARRANSLFCILFMCRTKL